MSVTVIGDAFIDAIVPVHDIEMGGTYHRTITLFCGGTANVARQIARLGERCKFVGKIGDDAFGRYFKQDLRDNGVEDLIIIDPELPTGLCVSMVYERGERTMVASRGANDSLSLEDVKSNINEIRNSRIVCFSGYSLLKETVRSSVLHCIEECCRQGVEICFNPGAPNIINEQFRQVIKGYVNVLILNQDEARMLTGEENFKANPQFLSDFARLVVVTQGGEGCAVVKNGEIVEVRINSLSVKDTTGAGDAFAAGFIVGRLRNLNEIDCARLANETALKFLIEKDRELR